MGDSIPIKQLYLVTKVLIKLILCLQLESYNTKFNNDQDLLITISIHRHWC